MEGPPRRSAQGLTCQTLTLHPTLRRKHFISVDDQIQSWPYEQENTRVFLGKFSNGLSVGTEAYLDIQQESKKKDFLKLASNMTDLE